MVAIATAAGAGAIGIVRLSGRDAKSIACRIAQIKPNTLKPRSVLYRPFYQSDGNRLDQGLMLFFRAPRSFTGEDMVELHTHGNPVILHNLIDAAISLGAEQAKPGEFSRRAYLNGKMDLTQAEAVADLINSNSTLALRAAQSSLQGAFAKELHQLDTKIMQLRVYVEAALDFPDEEIDFLNDQQLNARVEEMLTLLSKTRAHARQGIKHTEEMQLVILGKPNAGKSSLLNALCRQDRAIVSPSPGTTRDFIHQSIVLGQRSFLVADTAGIRARPDPVERLGIQHSWQQAELADRILFIYDGRKSVGASFIHTLVEKGLLPKTLLIENKTDLTGKRHGTATLRLGGHRLPLIRLSAKTGKGLAALIKTLIGKDETAPRYSARRRHLMLLEETHHIIEQGYQCIKQQGAGELFAEELKKAQEMFGQITGKVSNDDLLDKIFAEFCIGK